MRIPDLQTLRRRIYFTLLTAFGLAAGLLVLFTKWVSEIMEQEMMGFDQAVYLWVHNWQNTSLDIFMFWMTNIGSGVSVMGLFVIVLLWLYLIRYDLHVLNLFLITNLGGILLNYLLKTTLQRERPMIDPSIGALGYSLPSGHAMGAMIFYGFITYLLVYSSQKARMKIIFSLISILFILGIGLSRIYLKAHYASDVIAGYLAGGCWLSACLFVAHFFNGERQSPNSIN